MLYAGYLMPDAPGTAAGVAGLKVAPVNSHAKEPCL